MAPKITFTHRVAYVELESGAVVVMPTEENVALLESRLSKADREVAEAQSRLTELGKNASDEEKARVEQVEVAAKAIRDGLASAVADLKVLIEKYQPVTQEYVFEMHRFGHLERLFAEEESRKHMEADASGMPSPVNEGLMALGLLVRCIDSWNRECPITWETVGGSPPEGLPAAVVDSVYARLMEESAPTPARLSFPGAGGLRLAAGQHGIAESSDAER